MEAKEPVSSGQDSQLKNAIHDNGNSETATAIAAVSDNENDQNDSDDDEGEYGDEEEDEEDESDDYESSLVKDIKIFDRNINETGWIPNLTQFEVIF